MHYFRLQKKITRIIICSGKQALNQNKFHPPSKQPIAAHLPPFLNRPNRAARGPRRPDQPHAARQPTGLLCRCLKANRLGTRHPERLGLKLHPERKRWGKGEEDRDQRDHDALRLLNASLSRPRSILSSDLTLCTTTYTASQGWNSRLAGTCTMNDEMIHEHPQKWESAAKPSHSFSEAGGRQPTCRGWMHGPCLTEALVSVAAPCASAYCASSALSTLATQNGGTRGLRDLAELALSLCCDLSLHAGRSNSPSHWQDWACAVTLPHPYTVSQRNQSQPCCFRK